MYNNLFKYILYIVVFLTIIYHSYGGTMNDYTILFYYFASLFIVRLFTKNDIYILGYLITNPMRLMLKL